VLDIGNIILVDDHLTHIGIVITPVSTEVLLALRALYQDANDELGGSPLVMSVCARNVER